MSLYNFTSHTFTNAGATGSSGPTLTKVRDAYSTTTWANTYLNMTNDNGIQLWTVPKTGKYTIEAWGAAAGTNGWSGRGGYGARVSTNVTLTQGQILAIVIGQQGIGNSLDIIFESGTGGGGGSFVYDSTSITYYVVAGGGGGARTSDTNLTSTTTTADGTTSNNGNSVNINNLYTAAGGVDGSGGSISTRGILYGGPGAGIDGNGATNSSGSHGKTRLYGWVGGTGQYEGGFGGGGSSKGETTEGAKYRWGGGGGGYSGGGAGGNSGNSDGQYGGGGGSYYSGLLVSQSAGVGLGHGKVTITVLTSPATLTFLKTAFYTKYLLNSTISIPLTDISTNNTDTYTLTHSSGTTGGNTGVATVSTSANVGTVTIKGVGKTTITSTIAATANFDEITTTSITITVIGAGLNLTNEVMTSVDLSETDLTGSVFSGCDLTSANLYGATFNAATDLRGSTLTSLRSGRIIGNTTLLPVGYKII